MQDKLDRILAAEIGRGHCHEAAVCVMRGDQVFTAGAGEWQGAPVGPDTPFLIASTSKLLITAMILQLAGQGRLTLDDPVQRFLGAQTGGLHIWQGQDVTGQITLRHLLTHSSGLSDYFEDKRRDGTVYARRLFDGHDAAYGLDDVIRWTRDELRPRFAPGTGRKAHYSDTNFYLLAEVVARVRGQSLDDALAGLVTGPLGLEQTRFYKPGMPVLPLRYGAQVLDIPLAVSSMPGDGGAVSTAHELAIFASAFFGGRLFDAALLAQLPDWRRVFFPIQAGTGVLRFALSRWLPPFSRDYEFIGHSGIIGAFAFSCPARGLILAGTINQLQGRSRPYRLMVKLAQAMGRQG